MLFTTRYCCRIGPSPQGLGPAGRGEATVQQVGCTGATSRPPPPVRIKQGLARLGTGYHSYVLCEGPVVTSTTIPWLCRHAAPRWLEVKTGRVVVTPKTRVMTGHAVAADPNRRSSARMSARDTKPSTRGTPGQPARLAGRLRDHGAGGRRRRERRGKVEGENTAHAAQSSGRVAGYGSRRLFAGRRRHRWTRSPHQSTGGRLTGLGEKARSLRARSRWGKGLNTDPRGLGPRQALP